MSDSAIIDEENVTFVDCNICLQKCINPKLLVCKHTHCKQCLDSILQFRDDGSALITCPSGCNEETEIGVDKTTNDLESPSCKDEDGTILEEVDDVDDDKRQFVFCHGYPKCKKGITVACPVCFVKLCGACKISHEHEELQSSRDIDFVTVKYNHCRNELVPWCDEHGTYSAYSCQEGFICLYCKARSHSAHLFDKIETLSQDIEDWVKKQELQVTDLEYKIESSKNKTKEEMTKIRKRFIQEIKRRKYIAIQDYLKKVNEEEDRLLNELDLTMTAHIDSYPLCKPSDYIENIPKFEVFSNKNYIQQCVENITSEKIVVPNISLTFSVESMDKTQPLGLMENKVDASDLAECQVTVSSTIEEGNLPNKSLQILTEDLKNIREEFEKLNEDNMNDMATKVDLFNKESSIEEKKRFHKILRTYETRPDDEAKMCYLCDVIASDDIEGYKFMWKTLPKHLLALQHNGYNMLHYAATFNKPQFAKIVIEAGIDINKHSNGVTALLMATSFGNLATVQMLVECDADILIEEVDVNAVDIAKMVYNPEIVEYLTSHLRKCKMDDTGMLSESNLDKTIRALAIIREQSVDFDSDDELNYYSSSE